MIKEESTDLQQLQVLTNVFVQAIIHSTRKMPYGMRSIARETLIALKVSSTALAPYIPHHSWQTRFPNQSNEAYAGALGTLVFDRYINPAILYVILYSWKRDRACDV